MLSGLLTPSGGKALAPSLSHALASACPSDTAPGTGSRSMARSLGDPEGSIEALEARALDARPTTFEVTEAQLSVDRARLELVVAEARLRHAVGTALLTEQSVNHVPTSR